MIIYNYKKEFLGIDEKDLHALGLKNLQDLQKEVTDFADLFVKTPGYIHNFKHVHWIDFITCADSNEESKVIVNVNNKNYKAIVHITTTYLIDNPAAKAYMVHLTNLRELSTKESESISGDIIERKVPLSVVEPVTLTPDTLQETQIEEPQVEESKDEENVADVALSIDTFDTPNEMPNITEDPYEAPLDVHFEEESSEEESLPEIPAVKEPVSQDFTNDTPLDVNFDDDLSLDISLDDEDEIEIEPMKAPSTQTVQENFDNGYVYDPSVASDELGLPLDLIEEFIQDFIEQAKDFQENLYNSLEDGDLDNLKILSHKLKGVAANLRIEDALETITEVNNSADFNIIKENLDTFYKIIAKLAGEEISVEKEIVQEVVEKEEDITEELTTQPLSLEEEVENNDEDEDDLFLDIKMPEEETTEVKQEQEIEEDLYSDPIEIDDVDVPEKIEIAELADDTFEEEKITLDLSEDELTLAQDVEIDEIEFEEPVTEDTQTALSYDKEKAANDIGLDLESFNELFEDYISETEILTATLENAIANGDFTSCKNEALKLKGMSDNMRITSFTQELQVLINSSDKQELTDALTAVKSALIAL